MLARGSAAGRARAGLSGPGAVSIAAVVTVLVFVSLPRLSGLARHENESEARATATYLARSLAARSAQPGGAASIADLVGDDAFARDLADSELLEGGRLLRRHGYLFELVRLPAESPGTALDPAAPAVEPAPRAIRAWPWRHGSTGGAALLATANGALYLHPNTPPLWEGPRPRQAWLADWDGWRRQR